MHHNLEHKTQISNKRNNIGFLGKFLNKNIKFSVFYYYLYFKLKY